MNYGLYDYKLASTNYMAMESGEFLHELTQEDDEQWLHLDSIIKGSRDLLRIEEVLNTKMNIDSLECAKMKASMIFDGDYNFASGMAFQFLIAQWIKRLKMHVQDSDNFESLVFNSRIITHFKVEELLEILEGHDTTEIYNYQLARDLYGFLSRYNNDVIRFFGIHSGEILTDVICRFIRECKASNNLFEYTTHYSSSSYDATYSSMAIIEECVWHNNEFN